uniref:PDZ domain-containing protein 11 n=1 Tax=Sarcophilus harrisii TaxID=9305 RepID=A0A7N4NUH3_SARHA
VSAKPWRTPHFPHTPSASGSPAGLRTPGGTDPSRGLPAPQTPPYLLTAKFQISLGGAGQSADGRKEAGPPGQRRVPERRRKAPRLSPRPLRIPPRPGRHRGWVGLSRAPRLLGGAGGRGFSSLPLPALSLRHGRPKVQAGGGAGAPVQRVYHPDYNNELTQFLPRTIMLKKPPGAQLGFNIRGGKASQLGIFISKVIPDSDAHRAGLQEGDQVLAVNEVDFQDIEHSKAVEILKTAREISMRVRFFPYNYHRQKERTVH